MSKCDECGEHSYKVGIVKNDDGEYINGCIKCYPIGVINEVKQ